MSTTLLSPPCGQCHGLRHFQSTHTGRIVRCGTCTPDPFEGALRIADRYCKKCQMEFHSSDLRKGKFDTEHHAHQYAPCGHNVTFYGMGYTRQGAEFALYGLVATLNETQLLRMRDSDPFPGPLPGLMEAFFAVLCSYDEQGTRMQLYRWICDALHTLHAGDDESGLTRTSLPVAPMSDATYQERECEAAERAWAERDEVAA